MLGLHEDRNTHYGCGPNDDWPSPPPEYDPAAIDPDSPPPSFTCPRCGMRSYNPNDVAESYCGNCHDWTGDG